MEVDTDSIKWCSLELSKILNCHPSEEIVRYILGIEEKSELEEFLEHVVGENNQNFVEKLINHQKLKKHKGSTNQPEIVAYRKQAEEGNYFDGKPKANKPKNKPKIDSPEKQSEPSVKKKTHFIPLYDESNKEAVILPGRNPCNCEASKHPLINNCLECGRIACSQEGSGPCFTCGEMICTPEEQEILLRGSRKSIKLQEKLASLKNPDNDEQLRKAIEHKNKLLDFNRTSARRTQIIDDESDYFSLDANKWMTKEQRQIMSQKVQELHDKRHDKKSRKFTLDLAGRRVIDGDSGFDFQKETAELKALATSFSSLKFKGDGMNLQENDYMNGNFNPNLDVVQPKYEPSRSSSMPHMSQTNKGKWHPAVRLQDKELQEIADNGMCLVLHQPWASLLVMGIKKHEGRSWYSHYRGCLWIQSASRVPTPEEIKDVEMAHRIIQGDQFVMFPEEYPIGVLLGCVSVDECLPQDEYRIKYPRGESASPYVFICSNAQELFLKLPMKGKHKIFKMDKNIHQAAKNTLRKLVEK